jgi:hypothetical protein
VTAVVVDRFTQLFERHLWGPFVEPGLPAEDVRELTEVLQRLSALAEGVLTVTLRRSRKRAATAFLAAQAEQLEAAGVLEAVRPLAAAARRRLGLTGVAGATPSYRASAAIAVAQAAR